MIQRLKECQKYPVEYGYVHLEEPEGMVDILVKVLGIPVPLGIGLFRYQPECQHIDFHRCVEC